MKILIIGGTGVLSLAVTNEALHRGIKVTMINRGNRVIPNGVEHLKVDKDDRKSISEALVGRNFDAVIDFLCSSDKDTEISFKFYKQYTYHYFFISSCAVYNVNKAPLCIEDSPKIMVEWEYSIRKWIGECRLRELAKDTGVHLTIIRPCITYDNTRIPYGIAPMYGYHWTLVARILKGKPILRWNGGRNRCNMTRVEDFAIGVVGLIGNPLAYGEAFNVCGDEAPCFNDVLNVLGTYLGIDPIIFDVTSEEYAKEVPVRAGEILGGRSTDTIISNKKLKKVVVDFEQRISLKDGIYMTLDSYKANRFYKGIDYKFDGESDRIIANKCKRENIDPSIYNIGFIDYLGNATEKDKRLYLSEFHKSSSVIAKESFLRNTKQILRKLYLTIHGYSIRQ